MTTTPVSTTTICSFLPSKIDEYVFLDVLPYDVTFTRTELRILQKLIIKSGNFPSNQSVYKLMSIVKSIFFSDNNTFYRTSFISIMDGMFTGQTIANIFRNSEKIVNIIEKFINVDITNTWIAVGEESDLSFFPPYYEKRSIAYDPLVVYDGFPLLLNVQKVNISNLFQIPIDILWYPADTSAFPNIQSSLWAALYSYNISVVFPINIDEIDTMTMSMTKQASSTKLNFPAMSLKQLAGYIILTYNQSAIDTFIRKFDSDSSPIANLIGNIMNTLSNIKYDSDNLSKNTQLAALNTSIIPKIASLIQMDISNECDTCVRNGQLFSGESAQKCSTTLNNQVIRTVLSKYSQFDKTPVSLVDFVGICPIQVRTILSIFPYYNLNEISVVNGIIVLTPLKNIQQSTVSQEALGFLDNIKTDLEPDFSTSLSSFKAFVAQLLMNDIKAEVVNELIPIYQKFNGLLCTLIVATLIEFIFGISMGAEMMFLLIKQLTKEDIQAIDRANSSTCLNMSKSVTSKSTTSAVKNMISNLLSNPIMQFNVDHIEDIIKQAKSVKNINDQMTIISQYQYLSYSVMYYWAVVKKFDKSVRTLVLSMLLLSDLSDSMKNLIYTKMNMAPINLNAVSVNLTTSGKLNNTTPSILSTPVDFYSNLIDQGIDPSSDFNDIATYIRFKTDYNLYRVIDNNFPQSSLLGF